MKCNFCIKNCMNDHCSYYQEGKALYLAKDINIAFMEYYDITYAKAISEAYSDAYKAFCWAYERRLRVDKWVNY